MQENWHAHMIWGTDDLEIKNAVFCLKNRNHDVRYVIYDNDPNTIQLWLVEVSMGYLCNACFNPSIKLQGDE